LDFRLRSQKFRKAEILLETGRYPTCYAPALVEDKEERCRSEMSIGLDLDWTGSGL